MSKLLKVIVNTLLLLAILSAGALVIPPFAGITTLVSDGMGNTNLSRGAVTYAKKTETSSVASGDKILVDDNSGKYIYAVQSLDMTNGTASVKNVISGDTAEITVRGTVNKVIVTIPFIGFLSMAAQSKEGILIIGLAILFLIILFILSEVWKREEEEDEDEEDEYEAFDEDETEKEDREEKKNEKKKHSKKKNTSREEEAQENQDMAEHLEKMDFKAEENAAEEPAGRVLENQPEVIEEDEFKIRDLEEEKEEQVSFNTMDLQRLVRGEEPENVKTEPENFEDVLAETEESEDMPEAGTAENGESEMPGTKTAEAAGSEMPEIETVEETESEMSETGTAKAAESQMEKGGNTNTVHLDEAALTEQMEEPEENNEAEEQQEAAEEPDEPIELAMPVYTAEELLEKAHAAGDDPEVIEDPTTGITILDYSDIL